MPLALKPALKCRSLEELLADIEEQQRYETSLQLRQAFADQNHSPRLWDGTALRQELEEDSYYNFLASK